MTIMSRRFYHATEEYCTIEKHIPAPYIRRLIELDKPESAHLTICGLGYYRLFINGVEITKGRLAPYTSNPNHLFL